jgi:hypothetical protein
MTVLMMHFVDDLGARGEVPRRGSLSPSRAGTFEGLPAAHCSFSLRPFYGNFSMQLSPMPINRSQRSRSAGCPGPTMDYRTANRLDGCMASIIVWDIERPQRLRRGERT